MEILCAKMFRVNKALIGDNQGVEGAKYHVKFYCFFKSDFDAPESKNSALKDKY